MSLDLDNLAEMSKPQRQLCGARLLLAKLSDKDAAALQKAFAASRNDYPHTTIHKWLKGAGHTLSIDTIRRHRNGECACGR